MSVVAHLRSLWRTLALLGLIVPMLGLMELERACLEQPLLTQYKWLRRFGRLANRLYRIEVVRRGAFAAGGRSLSGADERGRGRLFVMNHRSMLDIFVCFANIEAQLLSRSDIARWPLIGFTAKRVGTLFVNRDSRSSGAAAVLAMTHALARGRGVLVFPEGTTFAGDDVRPFRSGAFRAAIAAGAAIVPLGIAYQDGAAGYGDETFFAHYRRIAGRPCTRIAIVAGEPGRCVGTDVEATREQARDRVAALVQQARIVLSRPG